MSPLVVSVPAVRRAVEPDLVAPACALPVLLGGVARPRMGLCEGVSGFAGERIIAGLGAVVRVAWREEWSCLLSDMRRFERGGAFTDSATPVVRRIFVGIVSRMSEICLLRVSPLMVLSVLLEVEALLMLSVGVDGVSSAETGAETCRGGHGGSDDVSFARLFCIAALSGARPVRAEERLGRIEGESSSCSSIVEVCDKSDETEETLFCRFGRLRSFSGVDGCSRRLSFEPLVASSTTDSVAGCEVTLLLRGCPLNRCESPGDVDETDGRIWSLQVV